MIFSGTKTIGPFAKSNIVVLKTGTSLITNGSSRHYIISSFSIWLCMSWEQLFHLLKLINKVELSDCKPLVPYTKDDDKVELFRSFKRIVHIGPICIRCSNKHRSWLTSCLNSFLQNTSRPDNDLGDLGIISYFIYWGYISQWHGGKCVKKICKTFSGSFKDRLRLLQKLIHLGIDRLLITKIKFYIWIVPQQSQMKFLESTHTPHNK